MSLDLRELRRAGRRLAARPVLVVVAVTSMGLGIGVNTAAFSLFNTVFLQAPSAVDPDRLVRVEFAHENHVSYPNARDLIGTDVVFSDTSAADPLVFGITTALFLTAAAAAASRPARQAGQTQPADELR